MFRERVPFGWRNLFTIRIFESSPLLWGNNSFEWIVHWTLVKVGQPRTIGAILTSGSLFRHHSLSQLRPSLESSGGIRSSIEFALSKGLVVSNVGRIFVLLTFWLCPLFLSLRVFGQWRNNGFLVLYVGLGWHYPSLFSHGSFLQRLRLTSLLTLLIRYSVLEHVGL